MIIMVINLSFSFSIALVAIIPGIPQPNIARFEKNTHSASLTTVIKILDSLGYKLKIEKSKGSLNEQVT